MRNGVTDPVTVLVGMPLALHDGEDELLAVALDELDGLEEEDEDGVDFEEAVERALEVAEGVIFGALSLPTSRLTLQKLLRETV